MEVFLIVVIKHCHKHDLVIDKTHAYVWIRQQVVAHVPIVDPNQLIDVDFLRLLLLFSSFLLCEYSDPEIPVVAVADAKEASFIILFHLFKLDVRAMDRL